MEGEEEISEETSEQTLEDKEENLEETEDIETETGSDELEQGDKQDEDKEIQEQTQIEKQRMQTTLTGANPIVELSEKRVVEAALFLSGRELSLEELRKLTGIGAMGYLQNLMQELKKEYDEKASAIEIIQIENKYGMRVRNQYLVRVKQFAQDSALSKHALRTLAFISKHDGILKSELVKKIGPQIYDDVRELVENEFVKTQKAGRTSKLTVTAKFRKYFEG
ncbi:MAG: SMC-Scp complex subunit ScpB [Candidatus Micrarchaeota archaeon]